MSNSGVGFGGGQGDFSLTGSLNITRLQFIYDPYILEKVRNPDIWLHCLTSCLSLCLPLKDSDKLMEQQGALLKRLAEADSEKAVTQRPLPALVAYRQQYAEGRARSSCAGASL